MSDDREVRIVGDLDDPSGIRYIRFVGDERDVDMVKRHLRNGSDAVERCASLESAARDALSLLEDEGFFATARRLAAALDPPAGLGGVQGDTGREEREG